MKVVLRTDASVEIGTGHVMRCLTLADALRERGAECRFICKEHPGHLIGLIRNRGYHVVGLPLAPPIEDRFVDGQDPPVGHASWLGGHWTTDAERSTAAIGPAPVDLLVVDHYAVDHRWESTMRPRCGRILVIDDLADRRHACDLLLDQNLGKLRADYAGLVPEDCVTMLGPQFALLAPPFKALREDSLVGRQHRRVRRVLVTMGGVDRADVTSWVVQAMGEAVSDLDLHVTVVMGPTAPHFEAVRKLAGTMPWPVEVRQGINDMARVMCETDLAIGAAGSTSWERCCLGVPSMLFVLAENQQRIANALGEAGAAMVIQGLASSGRLTFGESVRRLHDSPGALWRMSQAAASITDGEGVRRVLDRLLNSNLS